MFTENGVFCPKNTGTPPLTDIFRDSNFRNLALLGPNIEKLLGVTIKKRPVDKIRNVENKLILIFSCAGGGGKDR